jgi:hypothetical protein
MSTKSRPLSKSDGRHAPRPPSGRSRIKPSRSTPTLDSAVEFFQENLPSKNGRVLSLVSVRFQLDSMVRGAKFIDQPSLHLSGRESDLSAKELTQALKGLVKVGALLREVVPGLFLQEARNALESKQIAIAHLALARYLAALEGTGDAHGIMRAQRQVDTLMKGRGILLIPADPVSDATEPTSGGMPVQSIHLGEAPLLDLLLPQWRQIGDPNWKSPLGRHRGNWMEQAFMPAFEFLSKQLLMLFLLRGWPLAQLAGIAIATPGDWERSSLQAPSRVVPEWWTYDTTERFSPSGIGRSSPRTSPWGVEAQVQGRP